jgi:uncharacterized protein YndB with AHSA1/START domain
MLVRQVVIPAGPDELWEALTEPDAVSVWFGSQVEWELRPGGPARFVDGDGDGSVRDGVVVDVEPGRRLSFRWWPRSDGHRGASEVSYDLEPDDDGTRLTVTEQPLPAIPGEAVAAPGDLAAGDGPAPSAWTSWTAWDSRLFGCWAQTACVVRVPRSRADR